MLAIEPYSNMLTVEYCAKAVRLWSGVTIPPEVEQAGEIYTIPIPEEKIKNAHINPSVGDLSILRDAGTKLVFVSGQWDVLHADAEAFIKKMREAKCGSHIHCWGASIPLLPCSI